MRKIVLESPLTFTTRNVEMPHPEKGEVLVRIKKAGVCGSDIHLYNEGRIGEIRMESPLVLGHECMGEIAEVGPEVSTDLAGCRVALEPARYCGKCRWCKSGKANLCPEVHFLGLPPQPGALQEFLVHPGHLVVPLPDNVTDEAAVVLEPMAIAMHAINLVKVKPPQTVAILGTGVIGTCVLALIRPVKGLRIICVDLLPERLQRAEEMGADITLNALKEDDIAGKIISATGGNGADVVFECSGSEETMWNMCEVAAPDARIAVIGTNPEDRITFSSGSARRKGLTLRMVRRSLNSLVPCIRLTEEGRLRPQDLVTHTFAASRVREAFETVRQYRDGVLKALIDLERWE